MESGCTQPLNLGTEELITVDQLVDAVCAAAGKDLRRRYDLTKPQGVRGRNSDNTLLQEVTGWQPATGIRAGIQPTYDWIAGGTGKTRGGRPADPGRSRRASPPALGKLGGCGGAIALSLSGVDPMTLPPGCNRKSPVAVGPGNRSPAAGIAGGYCRSRN